MTDPAHEETDEILEAMALRIADVYAQALDEMAAKQKAFLAQYEKEKSELEERLAKKEIGKKFFKKWLESRAADASWYRAMVESLSSDLVGADKVAMAIVRGDVSEIFALNHDWATYDVESKALVDTSYALYNADAVARLVMEEPDLLPPLEVDEGKDLAWNRQRISSATVQGILQGESVPEMAARLQTAVEMGLNSAVRVARTAATSAQNSGRLKAYERASEMGIGIHKKWMATLDQRTRASHRKVDMEVAELGERFSNGLRYPGDPTGAASEVYNCRCRMVSEIEGVDTSRAVRWQRLEGMSYAEWREGKRKEAK